MDTTKKWNPEGFVSAMISRVKKDSACRAALTRADNPNTAICAWEYLVPYCNITNDHERLAFSLIGAAIAREKPAADGNQSIGQALCACCSSADDREREQRRFRRLLACNTTIELCEVLRSVIRYLQSKDSSRIGYSLLLNDLLYWNERVKLRWAKNFFEKSNSTAPEDKEDNNVPD